jgi:hypothetical protein
MMSWMSQTRKPMQPVGLPGGWTSASTARISTDLIFRLSRVNCAWIVIVFPAAWAFA